MSFAERLIAQRQLHNLKREQLAAILGISYSQIYRYELGENQPTAEVIIGLAKTFNVSADWLLGIDSPKTMEDLDPLESQLVVTFRSKPEERKPVLLEVMRLI